MHSLQIENEVYYLCKYINHKLHHFEELYYITKNTCNLKIRKIYLKNLLHLIKFSYLSTFVKAIAKLLNCRY